jgi:ferredoxin-NADP reductase
MQDSLTVRDVLWHGTNIFELQLERGNVPFTPGDCVALYTADGRVSRPYSIASGTDEKILRFVIRKMPGGVLSMFLSERKRGDVVRLSPPFGWFRPGENAAKRPFVFIATGTGIAPFLAHYRSRPDVKPVASLYGVREAADIVDRKFLADSGVSFAVSREAAKGCHHGRITGLLDELPREHETDFYLCGLDAMIDEVSVRLEKQGVPITSIHRECFFNASY